MQKQRAANPRTGSTKGQGTKTQGGQPQNWQHRGSGYKNRGRPTPELAAQGVRVHLQRAANPRTGSTGGQGALAEGGQPQNWQHRGSGCKSRGRPTPELAPQGVRVHLQTAANPRTGSTGGQGTKREGGQPQNWQHKGSGYTCIGRPTPECTILHPYPTLVLTNHPVHHMASQHHPGVVLLEPHGRRQPALCGGPKSNPPSLAGPLPPPPPARSVHLRIHLAPPATIRTCVFTPSHCLLISSISLNCHFKDRNQMSRRFAEFWHRGSATRCRVLYSQTSATNAGMLSTGTK